MSNQTENSESKKKSKLPIVIAVAAAVVIIATIYFIINSKYETTDNAQLDADIIPVKSSVYGYIKEIKFKDNQQVHKGDTLIIIDDIDLRTKVAEAQATLENSRANLLSVRSSAGASSQNANASSQSTTSAQQLVISAQARLTKSQADYKRSENMFAEKAATQSQLDAAKAELDVMQAQYNSAVSQFKSANSQASGANSQAEAQRAQISLAEALVKQREAELILAQTQLSYAVILSPCTGLITKRAVEAGQYITIAQPLCSAIDNSHLWVTANFKETQVKKIKPGQEVEVKIDAYPDVKLKGTIDSYIGATGAKFSLLPPDNSTGNFVKIVQRVPVRIELAEIPKDRAGYLYPGLSAFVEVKVK